MLGGMGATAAWRVGVNAERRGNGSSHTAEFRVYQRGGRLGGIGTGCPVL